MLTCRIKACTCARPLELGVRGTYRRGTAVRRTGGITARPSLANHFVSFLSQALEFEHGPVAVDRELRGDIWKRSSATSRLASSAAPTPGQNVCKRRLLNLKLHEMSVVSRFDQRPLGHLTDRWLAPTHPDPNTKNSPNDRIQYIVHHTRDTQTSRL